MLFSKPGLPLKMALAVALSVGSTSAALANSAAACQAGQAGCVLPVQDAVAAPVQPAPVYVDEDGGGGLGLLPILALLAAAAAILYFTVLDDDDDEEAISP